MPDADMHGRQKSSSRKEPRRVEARQTPGCVTPESMRTEASCWGNFAYGDGEKGPQRDLIPGAQNHTC